MIKNENNSPSKPQRVLVEQKSNVSIPISTPAFLSLAKKAGRNKVSLMVLEQVYCRGLLESVPSSKNTPEQQAFQRVDSFVHQGRAYKLDSDLISETPKIHDGAKHMHIIKRAIKGFEKRNKVQEDINEGISDLGYIAGRMIFGGAKRKGQGNRTKGPDDYSSYEAKKRQRDEFAAKYKEDRNNERIDAQDYVSRHGGITAAKTITRPDLTSIQRQDLGNAMLKRNQEVAARYNQIKTDRANRHGQGAVKAHIQKNIDRNAVVNRYSKYRNPDSESSSQPKVPKPIKVPKVKSPKGPPNIG